ncbi:MerR family transcriptional regulator [Kitasatospora aburaviensis]|uniref:MerR family transcriptional regulator n=1 Tax=Kitasatospora aburaviensis TaxID=67265 RepID=A0ABW1F8P1_9ACTN
MPHDLLSIGELAEQAGVSVKAVRFYSDRGLLPEADRSSGGHRRYTHQTLERLRLIRSLRGLDISLPDITRLLDTDTSEEESDNRLQNVVARRLDTLSTELLGLRWREAALRLLHTSPPGERAERLRLLGTLSTPPTTDTLVRYWHRLLPTRLPTRLTTSIVDAAVPPPPEQPSPEQVLAFAQLHQLTKAVNDTCAAQHRPSVPRPELLYDGLREAYELTVPALTAGHKPTTGEALDCFVTAHARSHQQRDTPAFRRKLRHTLTTEEHPTMRRYWALASQLTPQPTLGAAHTWLTTALHSNTQ